MQTPSEHTTPLPDIGYGMSEVISGFSQMTNGIFKHCAALEAENQLLKAQLHALQEALPNIVAMNKQKEWIAFLDLMYEKGMITGCTKKEYMQRMATALGSPGVANYSRPLYNIKGEAKYSSFLDEMKDIEQTIINKNND